MKNMATGLTKTDLDSDSDTPCGISVSISCVVMIHAMQWTFVIIEQANKFSFITSYYSIA